MKNKMLLELLKNAKDFADELTNHNVIEKKLNDPMSISKERSENNRAVTRLLLQRGVTRSY
ncbi:MAG TPA: hypothetical protein VGN20_04265 [Mucilaginibacter sp.]|jgi:DNA-damage-inducible protein D